MKQLSFFQLFVIILMCLYTGCTSKSVNNEISLKDKWTLSELLDTIKIKQDTLQIASCDPFLYYPFGQFRDIDSLNRRLSDLQPEIISYDDRTDLIYSQNENKLYFLKYVFDKNADEFNLEHKFIQIYSVNIVDSSVILNHNIHVGMSKQILLQMLNVPYKYNSEDIKIIELVSGLTGIWHYYVFDEDILSEIIIKTDYYFP